MFFPLPRCFATRGAYLLYMGLTGDIDGRRPQAGVARVAGQYAGLRVGWGEEAARGMCVWGRAPSFHARLRPLFPPIVRCGVFLPRAI
jgi:hypothetical protein